MGRLKVFPEGLEPGPDTALFPNVDLEVRYGWEKKVRRRLHIFTDAMGSTEIAHKNWKHFAAGAVISGVTLVCGENICGVDPELDEKGKVKRSPEMDR